MSQNAAEILLVEDDEAIAELERRILARSGWSVRIAGKLKDALAALRDQTFRAIVLDYRLPDGEPWAVIEAANLMVPRIPVIMVTAMGSEGVAAEALNRGVSDYVKKAEGFWVELPAKIARAIKAATAEQSLRMSDRLFQLIAGNLSDAIVVGDLAGGITYISPACRYILGYEPQELTESLSLEMVHPEDQLRMADLLGNIGKSGPVSAVYRLRAKQGGYHWIESNVNLLPDPEDGRIEVIAISRDVTERKNAEDEITKLNQTLDLVLNGCKDYAIFMLDCDGKVATWNSGAERIKGYTAAEVIGKHFSIYYPKDTLPTWPDELLKQAAERGRVEEEGWRVRKDGSRFWCNVVITALRNAAGELQGFSKVARDVTELKKTSDALVLARERAEEANRAKSEFLAAMSHEIRTPMNAILGMSDLLKETELDSLQRDYVERCRRAGASLLTLINDILDLSKIESGRFQLEHVPFDLENLVERTVEMIAPRAHLKGVGLYARIAPETPTSLVGDPSRLQQILINLLGNAAKFTQFGQIVLTISPDTAGADGQLRFEVSDTGIGIPPDKMDAIFEDFTQAESSTTRRFGGTGLGLGIARRLVQCMAGNVSVSSVVGQGSTFTFTAILTVNEHPVSAGLPKGVQDLMGRRVLVVDNNATNRLIISKMCITWGMIPFEASSAAEASMLVKAALRDGQPFSLAILDVLMPEVDGFGTLGQIRTISPDLPVIMTTSNNQSGDATKAKALGAAAFAVKPVRRAELLRLITAAMHSPNGSNGNGKAAHNPDISKVRILVAEDSEDNRFLLGAYLKNQPYALTFVEDGQQALTKFEKETFNLVLMDIQMPVMDGLQATKAIRALERQTSRPRTPVLALTANALLEDVDRSHAAGCDLHLSKPISREKLITAIENFRFVSAELTN
jgi:PAS domain S-box-containing protein